MFDDLENSISGDEREVVQAIIFYTNVFPIPERHRYARSGKTNAIRSFLSTHLVISVGLGVASALRKASSLAMSTALEAGM